MIEKRRDHHQSFFLGWFSTLSDFQANFFAETTPLNNLNLTSFKKFSIRKKFSKLKKKNLNSILKKFTNLKKNIKFLTKVSKFGRKLSNYIEFVNFLSKLDNFLQI